jgi:hypothetical protein
MTDSSVDAAYPYKDVELKPHMLCELAEKYFTPGSILQRKWLINDAPRIHLELGGRPTTADATSQAKKARSSLLSGDWEEAGFGSIRRIGDSRSINNDETSLQIDETSAGFILTADEWHGSGEQIVYCYTFPSYIELAALKGEERMPMKIGKTSSPSLDRVSLQCGVSNPEQPVVPLAIRVIWNRWIDDAPGTEWFKTSKSEILAVVKFLDNPPGSDAPSNIGVETDA